MERVIHKYAYNYCLDQSIFTAFQSGFIQGDSTTYQLLDEAIDSGIEVRAVFCDITKAFDRVWHKGLIHKLRNAGFAGKILEWLSDYLSNRRQRVVLNGNASGFICISDVVPQGSILGPFMFLIYINDIVETLNCNLRLFADDTSLYVIVENPITAANILNSNLSSMHAWPEQWLVNFIQDFPSYSFNPSKTESLIFLRKRNKTIHPQLVRDNIPITEVQDHSHLGITFSNDCSWKIILLKLQIQLGNALIY